MANISFNSILDGVSLALKAAFPDADIYAGDVAQGLTAGSLNVVMTAAGHQKRLGQRYERTPTLDVIYYPKEGMAECCGMAHGITSALQDITTPEGDVIHCSTCTWTVEDYVLHVRVGYRHFIYTPADPTPMETLTIQQEV